ncbi:MAG: hypothetical protein R2856_25410 [Caldilineaceae bacterium]
MTPTPSSLDLFSPEFKADPFPTYADLRRDEPVYCHHVSYGARIWYITRYEDVLAVSQRQRRDLRQRSCQRPRSARPGQ